LAGVEVVECNVTEEDLGSWLAGVRKPIGIMGCNDDWAHRALNLCGRQGIKVLLKFLLLEHEQIAHADLITLMDTVPLIAHTNRRFIGLDPSALADWASSELVRAGAARREGDRLLNA
jgi:hypothetical protein